MKTKDYLIDKAYIIIFSIIISFLLFSFLLLVNVNSGVIFIILSTILIIVSLFLIVEFLRRKKYYSNLLSDLNNLKEKYLLFDLMDKANFLDAKVIYEVIKQSNFAMLENVEVYKNAQIEYQRYIEMWVHEIKTPLTSLKLIVQNDESLRHIDEELDAINQYIDQALFYAKKSAVAKDYLIEKADLNRVIYDSIKALKKAFIKKDLEVVLDLKADYVLSDSKWLEFVIKQVLLNSIKYSYQSNKIEINSFYDKQRVILEIVDYGIGISEADIKRVFDLGFTGSSGRMFKQASGIGLYLTKELCDALNIGVNISSSNKTVFTFIFSMSDMHTFSNDNVS